MNSWNQWNAQGVTSGYETASNTSTSQHPVAATGAYPVGYSYYGQTQPLQTPIAGMEGYTSQQWNSLMQQQWQQWSNWQQQYQQWQMQYGDRYKESMDIEASQNVAPPLPSPDMSVPPPPPPPEEGPEYETSRLSGKTNWDQQSSEMYYGNMPVSEETLLEEPVTLTDDYRIPPPGFYPTNASSAVASNNSQGLKRSVDVSKYSHAGPDSNSVKKPRTDAYSMDSYSTRSGPMVGNIPVEEQLDNPNFGNKMLSTTGKGPQRAEPFVKAASDQQSGAEKKFDLMYEMWEEQFNNWRKQNIDNPDKAQYLKYEEMWKRWRDQLLQRKEQMKKRNRMSKDGDIVSDNQAEYTYGNWGTGPSKIDPYNDQPHYSVRPRNEDHGVMLNTGGVEGGNTMPLESGYGKLQEIEQNDLKRMVRPELVSTTLVSVDETKGFSLLQVPPNAVPCDSANFVQETAGNVCLGQPNMDPAKACEAQEAISGEPSDVDQLGRINTPISFIRNTSTVIPGLDLISNDDKTKGDPALKADSKAFPEDQSRDVYSGIVNESFDSIPGEEIRSTDLSVNSLPSHSLQGKLFDYGLSQEPLQFGPVKNKNMITSVRPGYPPNQISTNPHSIDTPVPLFKPGMHDLHNSQDIKNYQEPLKTMNVRTPLGPNRNIGNQSSDMYNYAQDNFALAKQNWHTNQEVMNYNTSNNSQLSGNFYPNVGEGIQSRQWSSSADLPLQNQGLEPKRNIAEGNVGNTFGNVSRNIPEEPHKMLWQAEGSLGRSQQISQGYKSHQGDNQHMSQNPVYEGRDYNTQGGAQMYNNQHSFTTRGHEENFLEGRGSGREGFPEEIGYLTEQNENQPLSSNAHHYDSQGDPNAFGNEMMWPQEDCGGTMVNKPSSNDVVSGAPEDDINTTDLRRNCFGENHIVVDYAHRSASKAIPGTRQ